MASQKNTTEKKYIYMITVSSFPWGEVCPLCSFLGLFTQGDAELCEMQIIIK